MAFSVTEKINSTRKLSQQVTGSADESPGSKFIYNEYHGFFPTISPTHIFSEFSLIPGAATPSEADTNVLLNPTRLEKRKVRLTHNPTSNFRQYECRSTFGDRTTSIYENWLQPTLIRKNGGPSAGYTIKFFHGDPDAGGVELSTTYLSGPDGEASWEFMYSMGIFKTCTDQITTYKSHYNTNGLFCVGYRYIGPTGGSGGGDGYNTLDGAYNQGGPGAGRIITVNAGPVEFNTTNECGIFLDGYMTLNSITDPAPRSNSGHLYSSNPGSGTSELFYMDSNGATTQITEDGYLATANSLTRVGLYEHNGDPHMNPGEGFLYAKPVSTGLELFFMDGRGRAIQITKDGKLAR